jgi:TIR domain/Tetratricopeptide repeat
MAEDVEFQAQQGLNFFISYAGRDRLWAEWAGGQLKSAGYTFELDLWHWLPGDNIILVREAALKRADRVLALCSAAYFGDGFAEQDWTAVMAAQQRKPGRLIPVWIEDLDTGRLPDMLSAIQPIKLFGLSEIEAGRRLLSSLAGDTGPESMSAFPGSAKSDETVLSVDRDPRMPTGKMPDVWHVPLRNPAFTGRDGMLIDVREGLLGSSPGVVILQGPGGMGKTQVSIEYAYRFATDYDIAWLLDGEQSELIMGQLLGLSDALGIVGEMKDVQVAAAAVRAALRNHKRWLLIFDNIEDPDILSGFVPDGQGHGHVIITTRTGGWQEIGSLISVEEFSRSESTALLATTVASLSRAAADGVAEALGDLPLALAQAAGILQSGLPAADFLRQLDNHATQALSESKPRSYPVTLAAATLIALDKLAADNPKAANLLRLCSYLAPEPIPATWFGELAWRDLSPFIAQAGGLPEGTWETSRAFGHIRDIGLGRVDQNGLRLHRLTQAILRDHTLADRAAYLNLIITILTAAAPAGSDDPTYWPDWSKLIPPLMLIDPERASNAFRPFACTAIRYLLVSGQAKAALTIARKLHKAWTAELGPDNADTLTMAQHLVHATHDNGDYAQAFDLQQDVLARRRRALGDDHPDTLRSASDLAVTINSLGRSEEALALDQDTYDRRRLVLGENHPDTLVSASNLAGVLSVLGRRDEGLALSQDTYDRRRLVLGENHPGTVASANNHAQMLAEMGRSREALALSRETYDRSHQILGEDHIGALFAAIIFTRTLADLGRSREALALSRDTYDRSLRVLGDDHVGTLMSANNLARTIADLGRPREALALSQDTYDRSLRVLGDDHVGTLMSAITLARTLADLGRSREALALGQDTYDRSLRKLGEDHLYTLLSANTLTRTMTELGLAEERMPLSQDTYDRSLRVLGEDHAGTLMSAITLARTLADLGQSREALALGQDTFDQSHQVLGEDHPVTLLSANTLAQTLAELGRSREAVSLSQDTYDRSRQALGDDHPVTLMSAGTLAQTLRDVRRRKEALALSRETYDRSCRVLGESHPSTLNSAGSLGTSLYQLGWRKEALLLRQDTYVRSRQVLGEDHPYTLESARNLADNLMGVGRRRAALLVKAKKPRKRRRR